ncbi:aurora kinase A- and ninein-interacting protein [Microcaecilia unicolor]|uniref:Aurora kinase A and ninein-interacting protein n=1 Tax=Microcaecilia unicolor TaxID=1415580 RepID=A0A6P7ZIQ6_9AMPH|nr:aurora kinase A and ninein-interacting protein [Microcaecilia unicolor]
MDRGQAESCGVWLDTARLKKPKRQTLLFGPTSKLLSPFLGRNVSWHSAREFTQTKTIRPCNKQTTISSFFIPKPAGKENKRERAQVAQSSPAITWKSNKRKADVSWKEPCHKRSSTELFQGIAEGDEPCFRSETPKRQEWDYNPTSQSQEVQQVDFNLASTWKEIQLQDHTLLTSPHKLTEQNMFLKSNYEVSNAAEYQPCARQDENGDSGSQLDFTQDSEGHHVIAHRSKHDSVSLSEFISNRKMTTVEISSPTLRDQWDLENSDPTEVERSFSPTGKQRSAWKVESLKCQEKVSRFPWKRESPAKATFGIKSMSLEEEEEQIVSESQLFTQDSQGHTVISHHYLHSSPRKKVLALHDRTNQLQSNEGITIKALPSKDCCRIFSCCTTDALANSQDLDLQSHYSLFFTQDSEGNTVIKHV